MKRKILIIDDSPDFRSLTRNVLAHEFDVETSVNGFDAMAKLQQGYHPDLIVTDLLMPELGGRDLVEQLKASGMYSDIPVIVLSSIDKSDEKIRLLNLGADDYLEKPYNPAELVVRINKILKNK